MNNYTEILRTYNLKATPQRLAILNTISNYGHINIDKLYEEVKVKFNSISLATIYKNTNAMISNMLLQEVKIPNSKSVYEITKAEHSHLLCKNCKDVIDVDIDIKDITKNLSTEYNFAVLHSDLVLTGICERCQTK